MGLRTGNCSLHSDAKLVPATSSPLYVHFFGLARRAECLIHTPAEYDSKASLTPYRLHALFSEEKPAAPLGTALLGAIDGKGFVAGMFHAIVRHDHCDVIWHTGGDTWLIDGETNPHVLRGIGSEDVFGHSGGVYKDLSQWMGRCSCTWRE